MESTTLFLVSVSGGGVAEDGSSSYHVSCKKRRISWEDIMHLFVRIFLTLFLYALSYFIFSRADLLYTLYKQAYK